MGKFEKLNFKVIHEDSEFIGLCEEFSSLSHVADSPREAMLGILVLVSEVLSDPDLVEG